MKFQVILSKLNDILKYPQRRGKKRLYQQWVERAGLPPEAIPEEEVTKDTITIPKIDKEKLRLNVPYVLLGTSIILLVVVLILIILVIRSSC